MASTILNPFPIGGALTDPSGRGFAGREDIFKFVGQSLAVERRVPILLHGQRRIGKSSILSQIPRHLPGEFTCIYFDLQNKARMQLDSVLYGLAIEIADGLGIDEPAPSECTEAGFPRFLDRAIQRLDGHAERLVLLFDEFDVIDQLPSGSDIAASRFIPYLGKLAGSYFAIGYILVVGRKIEEMSPEFFGNILKDSVSKSIGRLTAAETSGLAQDLASGHLYFQPEALDRIYRLTAGHPFCTQVLCHTIWDRALADRAWLSATVTPAIVDDALPQALELGSNGLNWTFDGLTKTEHRMVLSALAQYADPIGGGWATLDSIDAALRRWGIAFDSTDLGNAQRDLVKWDILIRRDSGAGYAVPMIGAWIKQNRPLEELLQTAVLANPRAQRYYDMALESLHQDKFDEAVSDFGSALNANPAFVEALEGLSSALRLRRQQGDLDLAVEAYERVLGLAPGAPRSTLIELLADAIDGGGDLPTITRYYRRLKELDPEGPYLQRAARFLAAEAHNHESHGYGESLDVARALYTELGDESGAERIRREKRRRMVAVIALLTPGLTVLALATFDGIYAAVFRQETVAAALYSAAAGAFVSTALSFGWHKGLQALRSLPAVILVALAAGLTAGLIERFVSWRTTTEKWVAGFGIAGFVAHMFLDAKMTRPKPIAPVFKVTKTKPADSDLQRKLIQTALQKLRPGDKVSQAK